MIDLNNLSRNIFELNLYQEQNKWRQKRIPIELSKNDSGRVIDLAIYKNLYALIKKLNVSLGDHNKKFICRRCLNSYTSENIILLQKPKCENNNLTTIRTSLESHLHWRKHFQKFPSYFRIETDFEADNEKDHSILGNKTTNIYLKNPVLKGYHVVSGVEDVLRSDYCTSPLRYDNVVWFVKENNKMKIKITFYFKDTKKDIIMTEEDEEDYRNNNICRFFEKSLNLIKLEVIVT